MGRDFCLEDLEEDGNREVQEFYGDWREKFSTNLYCKYALIFTDKSKNANDKMLHYGE